MTAGRSLEARSLLRLRIGNDTMAPRYQKGDAVFVDLNDAPSEDSDALIELHEGAGKFILRLVALTETTIVARQFNPPQEIRFRQADVKRLGRVVASFDGDIA